MPESTNVQVTIVCYQYHMQQGQQTTLLSVEMCCETEQAPAAAP